MDRYAWVTLATNDAYSLGALVLAHSLRRVGTKYDLVCMVTPGVTTTMREKLAAVFSLVQEVNVLDSKDEANLALLARPELGITFTKLHCWRLTQYAKCVFVDADALVVRNCDELFKHEELSAAPDVGWPDCFNSGVFVYKPSQQTFASIISFAATKGSFDGGDQGLLNMYFSDWATKDISKHLPFIYNMCSTATYSYLPAFKQFGEDVRIIHFIGITKPWLQYFDTLTGVVQPPAGSEHLQPLLQLWWNLFCERVHPQLTTSMAGIAGALAQLTLGAARSEQQIVLEEQMRKQSWEQGHIDYMGQDSFDNIWKKICETLSQAQQRQASPPKEDKPKDEGSSAPVAPAVPAAAIPAAIVEQKTPAAETDKDSTQEQSLICKLPEEKLPAPAIPAETRVENVIVAQPSEQKTPALAAEESVTVEAAATKPIQSAPEDAFVKPPTQESQDVKPCETCTEVPSPKPPVELPPPAETTAEQCKLVSPAMQEAASQDKSESVQLPAEATPPAESQACLLTSAVCKPLLPEAAAPVVQTEIAPAPADDKPQVPAPAAPATPETIQPAAIPETIQPAATPETIQLAATPETIQPVATPETTQPTATPIDAGTPQDTTASAVAPSETSIPEIGKPITECTTDVTQPLTIDPSERHAEMLLAASEISTVSPVPIQVAESVLQAEPKESVSDTAATVSDQVIATTVTAVTDVAPTIAAEPKEQAVQLNGLACDSGKRDDVAVAAPSPPEKTDAAAEPTKEASDSITVKDVPAEVQPAVKEKVEPISSVVAADIPTGKVEEEATKPAEQVPVTTGTTEAASTAQITTPEAKEAKSAEQQVTKTEATEAKPAEQIAKVKPAEEKPKEASEQPAKIEITKAIAQPEVKVAKSEIAEAKPTESTEQAIKAEVLAEAATAKPPGEVPKLPVAETPQQPPAEPVEAKALDIPSTPTVTEATPPTSPSVESAQETAEGQEKAAKKSLKKSDSADGADGESADKKAKKTVKKVTKKPKSQKSEEAAPAAPEAAPAATPFTVAATVTAAAVTTATVAATAAATATGDNSQSKAKKTVKVVKKTGAKSGGQSLEADTTVPETPPPPTTTAAATPDAPVPPKRKTKTSPPSAKGMTGKKSEAEE